MLKYGCFAHLCDDANSGELLLVSSREGSKREAVAPVDVLVLVLGAPVDDLDLVEVYEDAAAHGALALPMVLGGGEHSEHLQHMKGVHNQVARHV